MGQLNNKTPPITGGACGFGRATALLLPRDQVVGHPNATYEEFDEASGRENLFEHGGQPDFSEVAEGVLWLVSDRARLVTGHALPVDAGWIVKRGG